MFIENLYWFCNIWFEFTKGHNLGYLLLIWSSYLKYTLSQNGKYEDKCYHNNDSYSLTILTQNKLSTDCEEWKLVSLEQTKIWEIIHFIITNFDRVKCIIVMNYPSQLHCCSFSVVASEKFRARLFFSWKHNKKLKGSFKNLVCPYNLKSS